MASTWYAQNGQDVRTPIIINRIRNENFDVLAFCELFHEHSLLYFIRNLRDIYPHYTILPTRTFFSGGLMIMSKIPIQSSKSAHFDNLKGVEKLTSKGVLWVTLKNKHHIVLTHPQSWEHEKTRNEQFQRILLWVQDVKDPLIILGDLNIDYHANTFAEQLPRITSRLKFSQSKENTMRGNDTTAAKQGCGMDYYCNVCHSSESSKGACKLLCSKPVPKKAYCECCTDQLLDYAFIPKGHIRASKFDMKIKKWQSPKSMRFSLWLLGQVTAPTFKTKDLSDHYPVIIDWVPYIKQLFG